jgi:RNA polymerase sigma-70 factor (ECF subfamily)
LKGRIKRRPVAAGDCELPLDNVPAVPPKTPLVEPEELQTALDALPDEFKLIVLMFYFERLSYREIGERLDLPLGTVMSRLSRAKSRLRAQLFDLEPAEAAATRNVKPARVP